MVKETYKLPAETFASITNADLLDDLIDTQKILETQGVSTRNTRIERYTKYIQRVVDEGKFEGENIFRNSLNNPFEHSSDWYLYVLREVHELTWIIEGIKKHQPKGLKQKLKTIVGGSDFAALDRKSLSRDTQFELRIASYFCQSGFDVDLSTKTDLIIQNRKSVYFVECKRVATNRALAKRLKEAIKQLKLRMPKRLNRKLCYGIIAIDVTKIAYPHNGLTWAVTNEHSRDLIQDKLKEIANEIDTDTIFVDSKRILEIWLNIHIPSMIFQPPQNCTRFSFYVLTDPFIKGRAYRAFKNLVNARAEATKPDPRVNAPQKLTPRKSIIVPKDTTFSFDEKLLEKHLCTDEVDRDNQFSIICTANVNDEKYEFSSFELAMAIGSYSKKDKARLYSNLDEYRAEIFAALLLNRFPFEENEF